MLKRAIADLIRGGCCIETIAHDPPGLTFRAPDGVASVLRMDGRAFVLARELAAATAQFSSLEAAIVAACRVPAPLAG